jgi:hypothetical protein
MRDGIQLSEAITGDGARLSSCVLDGTRRHRLKAHRLPVCEWQNPGMAEDQEPGFSAPLITSAFERQKVRIGCGGG